MPKHTYNLNKLTTLIPAFEPDVVAIRALTSTSMTLSGQPKSQVALDFVSDLCSAMALSTGARRKPSPQYLQAVGALVADLLTAASFDPPRPCFRPMGIASFTGQSVGFDPFSRALRNFECHELVDVIRGKAGFSNLPGLVTRIWGTPALFDRLRAVGITPATRTWHFTYSAPSAPAAPLRLKAGNKRGSRWERVPGQVIPVDLTQPKAAALATRVSALNRFIAKQRLSLADPVQFFRGFNKGDDPAFDWNKGGRLHCVGGGYQQMSKSERSLIRINDMQTVEVDISACHLTIAYGLLGYPLPDASDIYHVDGLPRSIVKSFVNLFLGLGHAPSKWTNDFKLEHDGKDINLLNKKFPIKATGHRIISAHPILDEVAEHGLDWSDFQYYESEVITKTVYSLALEQAVCVLPVHDSLIVPTDSQLLAKDKLISDFRQILGVVPYIK